MLNNSKTVQDICTPGPTESRIWSIERRQFQWPWTTSTLGFKVTLFFDAEYLRNGTRYRHNFNGILIGTYILPTQQCHFEWPWVTSSDLFATAKLLVIYRMWLELGEKGDIHAQSRKTSLTWMYHWHIPQQALNWEGPGYKTGPGQFKKKKPKNSSQERFAKGKTRQEEKQLRTDKNGVKVWPKTSSWMLAESRSKVPEAILSWLQGIVRK